MGLKINYASSGLSRNLDRMAQKLGAVILMYAATKAQQLESTMKARRPWRDRTNMAKVTLNAKVSQPDEKTVRITLAHGVEYGIWLELANEKKYAIVAPTVRNEAPRMITELNDLMSKLKL